MRSHHAQPRPPDIAPSTAATREEDTADVYFVSADTSDISPHDTDPDGLGPPTSDVVADTLPTLSDDEEPILPGDTFMECYKGDIAPRNSPPEPPDDQDQDGRAAMASVTIGDVITIGVLDTGAGVCILGRDGLRAIERTDTPLDPYLGPKRIKVGDGRAVRPAFWIPVPITIGTRTVHHHCYVLPNGDFGVLLGMNFLRKHKLNLFPSENCARFGDSDETIPFCGWSTTRVFVADFVDFPDAVTLVDDTDVVVPPRSSMVVEVQLPTDQPADCREMVLVPPAPSWDAAALDLDCIVRPGGNRAYMAITNRDVKAARLRPNALVARVDWATSEELAQEMQANHAVAAGVPSVASDKDAEEPEVTGPETSDNPWDRLSWEDSILTEGQREEVLQLLLRYPGLTRPKPGVTKVLQHGIDTGDSKPIRQPGRRQSPEKQEAIVRCVEEQLAEGIIEASSSAWRANPVLIRKKDGTPRFCVDYRDLNNATKKDVYPLPRMDDTLAALAGAQVFSSLDLKAGYWQVLMDPDSRAKTAFLAPNGLWQYRVMPFGLTNAPATFQRLMDRVLGELKNVCVLVYLDDIIVFSRDFDDHIAHLKRTFEKLEAANLTINLKKCQFGREYLEFLGHVVAPDGIRTSPRNTEKIAKFSTPQNKKDVATFLGLAGYYRQFISDFSRIAAPLEELKRPTTLWSWSPTHDEAFRRLRDELTRGPVLRFPDLNAPFFVQTDASQVGLGAVLGQIVEGEERVVCYASRVLTVDEQAWHSLELELLAVIWALETFRFYLDGREFTVQTDAAGLLWLSKIKEPTGRLGRWILRLSIYNFRFIHRKGTANANADALSREPRFPERIEFQKFDLPSDAESFRWDGTATLEAARQARVNRIMARRVEAIEARIRQLLATRVAKAESLVGELALLHGRQADAGSVDITACLGGECGVEGCPVLQAYLADTFPVLTATTASSESEVVRAVTPQAEAPSPSPSLVRRLSVDDVTAAQRQDPLLAHIVSKMVGGETPPLSRTLKRRIRRIKMEDFALSEGVLYYTGSPAVQAFDTPHRLRTSPRGRLVLPVSLREEALRLAHDTPLQGHRGAGRTMETLSREVYWPGMLTDVKRFVEDCTSCQLHRHQVQKRQGELHPTASHKLRPWEAVAVDLMGPYPVTEDGNKFIVVFVDYYTRWPEAQALPDSTAPTVAKAFVDLVVSRYGSPKTLLSDQGPQFTSDFFTQTCQLLGVKRRFTTVFHPQANLTERVNQEIKRMTRKFCYLDGNQRKWDRRLQQLMGAIRFAPNATLGESPAFLNFGRVPRLPIQWTFDLTDDDHAQLEEVPELGEYLRRLHQTLEEAKDVVRDNVVSQNQRYKAWYDTKRRLPRIREGDYVRVWEVKKSSARQGLNAKLSPTFSKQVYQVIRVLEGSYVLRDATGKSETIRTASAMFVVTPAVAYQNGWPRPLSMGDPAASAQGTEENLLGGAESQAQNDSGSTRGQNARKVMSPPSSDVTSPASPPPQPRYPRRQRARAAARHSVAATHAPSASPAAEAATSSTPSSSSSLVTLEDGIHIVERIVDWAWVANPPDGLPVGDYYKVKWKGYGQKHCTWEPEVNLHGKALKDMMAQFRQRKKGARREMDTLPGGQGALVPQSNARPDQPHLFIAAVDDAHHARPHVRTRLGGRVSARRGGAGAALQKRDQHGEARGSAVPSPCHVSPISLVSPPAPVLIPPVSYDQLPPSARQVLAREMHAAASSMDVPPSPSSRSAPPLPVHHFWELATQSPYPVGNGVRIPFGFGELVTLVPTGFPGATREDDGARVEVQLFDMVCYAPETTPAPDGTVPFTVYGKVTCQSGVGDSGN